MPIVTVPVLPVLTKPTSPRLYLPGAGRRGMVGVTASNDGPYSLLNRLGMWKCKLVMNVTGLPVVFV